MELTGMTKQIIDFQKASFDQIFAGVSALHDFSENLMDGFLNQAPWINEESKKPISDSMKFVKNAREDYKKAVYQGFAELEKLVDSK